MDLSTIYSITEDKIDINALLDQITWTSTGAAAIFTGFKPAIMQKALRREASDFGNLLAGKTVNYNANQHTA